MAETSSDWFGQVRREPRLVDQVADRMLETIIVRGLRPGDKLPSEREISEQFGVSRTVVREAVQTLAGKGVIEARSGSGLRVAEADGTTVSDSMQHFLRGSELDYAQIHEVRVMLEVEIAGLAAERATPADLEDLRRPMTEMEQAIDDHEAASEADVEYHRAIAAATHNPLHLILLDSIGPSLLEIRRATLAAPEGAAAGKKALQSHREILERIEARDRDGACTAMKAHLESVAGMPRDEELGGKLAS
jgi:GntR family transcriptional repressor for pyruvate dehydrogenase complex